ncbi:HNH endonuclease family protein [Leucobacter sp.]
MQREAKALKKRSWAVIGALLLAALVWAVSGAAQDAARSGGAAGSGAVVEGSAHVGSEGDPGADPGSNPGADAGTNPGAETDPGAEADPAPDPGTRTAEALLETLPVKGRAPKTGYDRAEQFGKGWKDPDRNGCDARNDTLQRDLADAVLDGPCKVLAGVLTDPYTGTRIDFVRGQSTSQAVQIDHVVALSDAWQKGAQSLAADRRVEFANDPLNLLAVDGPTNNRKGDADAASWLPPQRGFRCEYVARQVSVKAAYGLWVTAAERDAIRRVLADCPAQPAYSPDEPPTGPSPPGHSTAATNSG